MGKRIEGEGKEGKRERGGEGKRGRGVRGDKSDVTY